LQIVARGKRPKVAPPLDQVRKNFCTLKGCIKSREKGYDIGTVQELLGHKDVKTTMIYTHVLNRGGKGVLSPMDKV
jgi:integrase